MIWLQDHITGLAWTFAAWALVIAVVAGLLYARWRRHEDHDAAATEEVMDTLGFDRSHAHEQDIV